MSTVKGPVVAPAPWLVMVPWAWKWSPQSRLCGVSNVLATRSGKAPAVGACAGTADVVFTGLVTRSGTKEAPADRLAPAPESKVRPSRGSNRRIMGPRPHARRRAAARRSNDDMRLPLLEKAHGEDVTARNPSLGARGG